ncbi:MAG TPA: N-acetylmuramoyl-L-alanine amidase [Methyloceanibacter sp.]
MRAVRVHLRPVCLVFTLLPGIFVPLMAEAGSKGPIAKDARVAGDFARTRFIADLSRKVDIHAFALDDPYRVIIDLPDISFQMPAGLDKEPRGLIKAYRYGLFAPGKSRIVIDVNAPFLIDKVFVLDARDAQPARLVVDLVATDRDKFMKTLPVNPATQAAPVAVPAPEAPQPPSGKPVVIIDPGHGGIDPGTTSSSGVTEKDVVLAFGKALKDKLEAAGHYDVHMTRQDDTFLPLRDRVTFAQTKGASLFLSVHADSFPENPADAKGATVYTLSEEASDQEAKELAAKENFSDALAGSELPSDSDEVVANILIDLAQRETQNRSLVFARSMVGELKGNLHSKAMKSAGFRVLKAPDIPSVLLELGFLSNPDDEKELTADGWREATADRVAKAIDGYFAKRLARNPY